MRHTNQIELTREEDGRVTYSREFITDGKPSGHPIRQTFGSEATAREIARSIHWGCCGWDSHDTPALLLHIEAFLKP
jgi:hypothetical protein